MLAGDLAPCLRLGLSQFWIYDPATMEWRGRAALSDPDAPLVGAATGTPLSVSEAGVRWLVGGGAAAPEPGFASVGAALALGVRGCLGEEISRWRLVRVASAGGRRRSCSHPFCTCPQSPLSRQNEWCSQAYMMVSPGLACRRPRSA
jgi:hypothetical protein